MAVEPSKDEDTRRAETLRGWGERYAGDPAWQTDLATMQELWREIERQSAARSQLLARRNALKDQLQQLERRVEAATVIDPNLLTREDHRLWYRFDLPWLKLSRKWRARARLSTELANTKEELQAMEDRWTRTRDAENQLRERFMACYRAAAAREDGG